MATKTKAPLQASKYRLSRVLSHTALYTTYLVTDIQATRQVVIVKYALDGCSTAEVDSAVAELQALAQLRRPHLLGMDQVFARQKKVYVISEDEVCESLADLVRQRAPLPPEFALTLTNALADAVGFWHSQGRVHADLHSGNVLLSTSGELRLGPPLLSVLPADQDADGQNADGPHDPSLLFYRAPELLAGGVPTPATDQYAVAALAYEMLTGRSCYATLRPPSAWNPQLPVWVDPVLLRALSPDPIDRYESVAVFQEALAQPQLADQWIPAGQQIGSPLAARLAQVATSPARVALLVALGLLLLTALMGLLRAALAR